MRARTFAIGFVIICLTFVLGCTAYPNEDYTKVLVLHLNISNGTVNEQSVEMQYGHPPAVGFQSGYLRGSLRTSGGGFIQNFDLWDPRYQLTDTGSLTYTDTADFTLVMPYYKDQMTLDLSDKKSGTVLKTVNFSDAIDRFRATYPEDPDVTTNPGPAGGIMSLLGNASQGVTLPPIAVPVTGPIPYLILGGVLILLFIAMVISMTRKK